jgi:hypothetical protein
MLIKFLVIADIDDTRGFKDSESPGADIAAAMKEHIEKTALEDLDYYIEAI